MYTKKTTKFDRFFNMKRSITWGSHYNHFYYHLDAGSDECAHITFCLLGALSAIMFSKSHGHCNSCTEAARPRISALAVVPWISLTFNVEGIKVPLNPTYCIKTALFVANITVICWRSSPASKKMLINRFLVGICGRETISEKSVKNSSFEVHKKILGKDKPTRVIDFLKKASLHYLVRWQSWRVF